MKKIILDKKLIEDKYINENKTIAQIADELNVCLAVVRRSLKENGIKVRSSEKEYLPENALFDLYVNNKLSIRKVASLLNVPETRVRKSLNHYGIEKRTREEGIKLLRNGKTILCEECGKEVYLKNSKLSRSTLFFCSHQCQVTYYGRTRRTRGFYTIPGWRRSGEGRAWRNSVLNRDKNKCVLCGDTNKLEAHHILEISNYPELKNNVDNGVTLCKKCHLFLHANNAENYVESLRKVISVENPNIGGTPEMDNPETPTNLVRSNDYQGSPNL